MMAATELPAGWRLAELLAPLQCPAGGDGLVVGGLSADSRRVRPGDVFLALPGRRANGLRFAAQAAASGAVAVLYDPADGVRPEPGVAVPVFAVPGLNSAVGTVADRFFGEPSAELRVLGITGTNGKTSCSHFLAEALGEDGSPCGLIGTLGTGLFGALAATGHTTPDVIRVHQALREFRSAGAERAVMEVSSHALEQGRVAGVRFDVAVFTNLSHEHLDYHGDMAAYEAAKARLFRWPGLCCAVINVDDPAGRRLLAELPTGVEALAYGLEPGSVRAARRGEGLGTLRRLQADALELDGAGMRLRVSGDLGQALLEAPLLGRFNASNLLAVTAALAGCGWDIGRSARALARLTPVPGRMERFGSTLVVDYAHTPDALEQALSALREHCAGRLWCVFGCGGERDAGKRPLMGRIAERLADRVVVTDDNPRGEDGDRIVADILAGMGTPGAARVERDRERAVRAAHAEAEPGDLVLIAGKGHEDYQQVGAERRPYSDRVLAAALSGAAQP